MHFLISREIFKSWPHREREEEKWTPPVEKDGGSSERQSGERRTQAGGKAEGGRVG